MSQDTVMTTTPTLTILCSSTSSVATSVMMMPAMVDPPAASGQQDVVLPPLLLQRDARVLFDSPQCCSSYLHPRYLFRHMQTMPWVLHRWLFQCWASHWFVYRCWMPLWCMLYTFSFPCGCHFHLLGSTIGVCTTAALGSLPVTDINSSWWWSEDHTSYALSGCSLLFFE